MEQRRLGGSGLYVSRLGLGTMTWGRDTDQHDAREQLKAYADAGGTLVDTAASYGGGESEKLVGALLDSAVSRTNLLIATKAGTRRTLGGRVDVSRKGLLDQLDDSLDRLDLDYVDLWQVDAWSDAAPMEETLAALEHAVTSGRARYAGVSNYAGWQTAAAAVHQRGVAGTQAPLVSTQVEYSLLERGVEREVLPAASRFGLGVLAWSPLGRGVLTGKYRSGTPADSRAATTHFAPFVDKYLDGRSAKIVDAVCTAADGLDALPLEVALTWVRDRPGVSAAIVGARTAGQLRDVLGSDDLELPAEIRAALDEVSAIEFGYPENR
ncbi:aldo/keto reductase [Jiangella aurantiaca]|uniref:Aldo/keto reductase n=1 Tax=Jiangella aurantiaca TaxID=2530373 RepID=A0A4R5A6T6_9ACTN|nr:aldo/keto reductase [Jiangella aurantiaca]TDD66469.1 aldo/keto reductase [Jiangella aurantiaca]